MVIDMQMSVEELFIQTEREYEFDSGYNLGFKEGFKIGYKESVKGSVDEIIINMLESSVDDELIMKCTKCSGEHLQELKKFFQ